MLNITIGLLLLLTLYLILSCIGFVIFHCHSFKEYYTKKGFLESLSIEYMALALILIILGISALFLLGKLAYILGSFVLSIV